MSELTILFICCWALCDVRTSLGEKILLIILTLILMMGSVATRIYSKKSRIDTSYIRIAIILTSASMMIGYSYHQIGSVLVSSLTSAVAFIVMYILGKTQLYRWKLFGQVTSIMILALLIATRVVGNPVNGAFVSLGTHILTLAIIVLMLPFAMGFFLRSEIDNPLSKKATALPVNQILLLLYCAVIAVLTGLINNEFGTVLIVCGTIAVLFVMYGRNFVSKVLLFGGAVGIIIGVIASSGKAYDRFMIFWEASGNESLYVKKIVDTATSYGLFGMGNGQFIAPNLTSDYTISTLLFNNGMIFAGLIVALMVLFILKILLMPSDCEYDRIISETTAIMLFVMCFLGVAGPIQSCPLTGVGLPLISIAKGVNSAIFGLLGILLAIKERGIQACSIKKH